MSNKKLNALDDDQKRELIEWLLSPQMPYRLIQKQVAEEFGIECSFSALSKFYQEFAAPIYLRKRHELLGLADEIAKDVAANPGRFDAATIDALKRKALEMAVSPATNPADVKAIFSLVLKSRAQDTDQEKLALDKDKFQNDFATAAMKHVAEIKAISADRGLSSDEKILAVRRKLFGSVAIGEAAA